MNWNNSIRIIHRWTSIAFTAGVILNIATLATSEAEQPEAWVGFMALGPLIVLLLTGLYLFALPYGGRRKVGGAG